MAWDISPEAVGTVLETVGGHAEDLGTAAEDFGTHMEDAATAAASGPIGQALEEFAEHHSSDFEAMFTRVGNTFTAAVDATTYYVQGDLDMATEAQGGARDEEPVEPADHGQ